MFEMQTTGIKGPRDLQRRQDRRHTRDTFKYKTDVLVVASRSDAISDGVIDGEFVGTNSTGFKCTVLVKQSRF